MNEDREHTATGKINDSAIFDISVRMVFLALIAYVSLVLVGPFVTVALWGVILAVALYPVFAWLGPRLGGRGSLAAALITIVFILIILGPVSLLAVALVENLRGLSGQVEAGTLKLPAPVESVRDWPLVGGQLYAFWELASTNLEGALARVQPELKSIGGAFLSAAAGTGLGIIQFVVAVIIAGFLYVPAGRLTAGCRALAKRVAAARGDEFVDLASTTIRNVARGVIGISLLQSLLIGIGLLVAAVPGAGLITFGALILAIIQIGPGILVIGTIVWAWMSMETIWAVVFTVYMIPAMLIDNILRPIVMSRGLSTPMVVIFIGVLGGTLAYGLIGLFLGPIVLAVAYELLVRWVRPEGTEDSPEPG
jgi:predicted PurR-regulated permease PerM